MSWIERELTEAETLVASSRGVVSAQDFQRQFAATERLRFLLKSVEHQGSDAPPSKITVDDDIVDIQQRSALKRGEAFKGIDEACRFVIDHRKNAVIAGVLGESAGQILFRGI